jgi:lipopolysaccharide/colanic/teichoic acid biosynthesis glycosyltransferase
MQLPIPGPESGPLAPALRDFPPLTSPAQAAPLPYTRIENPSASNWSLSISKRFFDVSAAILCLTLFAVPMLLIALCIRLSSPGPALFVQNRLGRGGRLFGIYKFRSMVAGSGDSNGITANGDLRITALGRCMRRLKIDELPQLYNILRGDMSLVGPRPKLPQYEGIVNMPYRPGVTGAATIVFRREEELLMHIHPSQRDLFYAQSIKPLKTSLDVRYMSHATFWTDLRMIAATLVLCLKPARVPRILAGEEKQLGADSITA